MKSRKSSKHQERPQPAVQADLAEPPEEGLSVDADELGASFLRYATEQGNFETARAVPRELADEPLSDDAPRDAAAPGTDLWDRTVDKVSSERESVDPEKLDDPFDSEPPSAVRERPETD